jgi:hypothetical protein
MAYVGNPIDTQNTFQSLVGKRFNGDGSTTAFTLDVAPSSTLDIEVFVGNVRQDPNSAYTLSGTTLTFTGAPPSGTNNIYVVHQAKSVGTIDVPASGVQAGSLASSVLTGQTDIGGAIADADLFLVDDGAGGTLRKTAASRIKTYVGGFDVSSITGATELAAQPAATDEIVLSDAGTLKRLDIKHIQNTPAFQAFNSSTQTISTSSYTTLAMGSELFDSDSAYDTSNYRFTPGVSGKYYLYATTRSASNTAYDNSIIKIKKNGSDILFTNIKNEEKESVKVFGIVDSDADDYFHVEYYQDSGGNVDLESGNTKTYFGGFRIAGV